jgi:ATP synthase subunit 6
MSSFVFSPLEQFQILKLSPLFLGSFDFCFTNSSFLALLTISINFFFFSASYNNARLVPFPIQTVLESIYSFVFSLATENIRSKQYGQTLFPIIFTLFSFIFFVNLVGMIPYSFTVTSHIIVTFSISLAIFTAINVFGVRIHGVAFLGLFLPSGCPLPMAPFLILIELVSYLSRVFSLAIRLFANMMAGHTLLKILAGFSWSMFTNNQSQTLMLLHFLPFFVIVPILGLELGVAFLQAYVFTVLSCIYFNDAISLH